MKEQQITRVFQELAGQEVPASLDLWPAIQAQVQPPQHPSWWTRLKPTTRLGWAGLITVLLLVVSAGAYAMGPLLSRVFQMEAGLHHIEQANLGQEINLSQTVDDITVTLHRVYADANRIVVGYTVNGSTDLPDNRSRLIPVRITLTDEQGTVFSVISGVGRSTPVGPGAETVEAWTGGVVDSYFVDSYDAAVVQGTPEALHLSLVMDVETYVVPTPVPPTPGVYKDRADRVLLDPLVPALTAGPFTLNFSVPFIPGRTIEVQQEVEVGRIAVRLERVVVTPSATRAILCFNPPDGESEEWLPVGTLSTQGMPVLNAGPGGKEIFYTMDRSAITTVEQIGEGTCYRYSVLAPLFGDQSSEWTLMTLTVTELVGFHPMPPGGQTRLSGPWIFRFRVP